MKYNVHRLTFDNDNIRGTYELLAKHAIKDRVVYSSDSAVDCRIWTEENGFSMLEMSVWGDCFYIDLIVQDEEE